MQSESPSGANLNSLGVYLLVSLFFVVASFIEFGLLLMLKRANLLGVNETIAHKNRDNKKHEGSELKFARRSKTAHDIGLETRYSFADKIDFGSFIFFVFAYILFNVAYIMQCAI